MNYSNLFPTIRIFEYHLFSSSIANTRKWIGKLPLLRTKNGFITCDAFCGMQMFTIHHRNFSHLWNISLRTKSTHPNPSFLKTSRRTKQAAWIMAITQMPVNKSQNCKDCSKQKVILQPVLISAGSKPWKVLPVWQLLVI